MVGQSAVTVRQHSNSYDIFILVLTIMSLAVMILLLLPLAPAELETLRFYDNLFCIVFLGDFTWSLVGSHPRREYFVERRGWIDLLGSIPSVGFFPALGLLRLFRLFRLVRIWRMLSGQKKKELIEDILHNRSQYATFITLLLVMLVLVTSSLLVLQFESRSPEANITTGGDALWWSVVTITTVGYGDHYPVTTLGRLTGVYVMFAGVGIIGALASILASLLVSPAPDNTEGEETAAEDTAAVQTEGEGAAATTGATGSVPGFTGADLARTQAELAQTRAEMAELRRQLALISLTASDGGAAAAGT
jgi:voltage-gated potassium channel